MFWRIVIRSGLSIACLVVVSFVVFDVKAHWQQNHRTGDLGLMDTKGNWVVPPSYSYIHHVVGTDLFWAGNCDDQSRIDGRLLKLANRCDG